MLQHGTWISEMTHWVKIFTFEMEGDNQFHKTALTPPHA